MLTDRYSVELQQHASSPNQGFSINSVTSTLSYYMSDLVDFNGYSTSSSPPDEKRHIYTTNLLAACKLILTIKEAPQYSPSYSRFSVEVIVAVDWLLKSYWNSDSSLFKPIEHMASLTIITAMFGSGHNTPQYQPSGSSGQRASKAARQDTDYSTSLLYSGSGSGNGGPQQHLHTMGLNCYVYPCHGVCSYRLSADSRESIEWLPNSDVSATGHMWATPRQSSCPHLPSGYCHHCVSHFNPVNAKDSAQRSLIELWNDFSDVQPTLYSGQPYESNSHGIGFNPDGSLNNEVPMHRNLLSSVDNYAAIDRLPETDSFLEEVGMSITLNHSATEQKNTVSPQLSQNQPHLSQTDALRVQVAENDCTGQTTCDEIVFEEDGQQRLCGRAYKNYKSLASHKSRIHTGQKNCYMAVVNKDGQTQPCGKVFKNAGALACHKNRYHNTKQTSIVTVIGEDGQHQLCGKLYPTAHAISIHKRRVERKRNTCNVALVSEDGLQRPCGMLFKNVQSLSVHKNRYHTGQQACDVIVVGEGGLQRPCGIVCKNTLSLSVHKSRYHTGQKTCDVTMIGKNGLQQPCGMIFKNAQSLSSHKGRAHSKQKKICDATLVGENGLQRQCGLVCKNAPSLSVHKSKYHRRQQTCNEIVVGKNGQLRPYGKFCKNAGVLRDHKKTHRKRQSVDANQDNDSDSQEGKVNKAK